MTDYQVLYEAEQSVEIPIDKPKSLEDDKELWDEYAHVPYTNPEVACAEIPNVTSLEVDEQLEVDANHTAQINVTVVPEGSKVTFKSEDPSIATVDADGLVEGIAAGQTTTIIVKAGTLKAECEVTVKNPLG